MSQTIIPTVLTRRGDLVELHGVPEALPDVLAGYDWPEEHAERLAAADTAADNLYRAFETWADAHEELEAAAPAADQAALVEAIRAGKPDPGTPATDKANRAEHVAWTRLELALDDARAHTHKAAVADYLRAHEKHLAAHELDAKAAHDDATGKARAIMAAANEGVNRPGAASTTMREYVATRWDGTDAETLLTDDGTDPQKSERIRARNAEIIAGWKRRANQEPEPTADPIATGTATELSAAASHGSAPARAELARRRAASRG